MLLQAYFLRKQKPGKSKELHFFRDHLTIHNKKNVVEQENLRHFSATT
jgi:hypothetical protein